MGFLYLALIAGLIMLFINLIKIQLYKFAKMEMLEQRAKLDFMESLVYLFFVIMFAGVLETVGGIGDVWSSGTDTETSAFRTSIDEAYKLFRSNSVTMDIEYVKAALLSLNNLMVEIRTQAINQYNLIINRYSGFDFGLLGVSFRGIQRLVELATGEMKRVAKALVTLAYVIRATVTLNVLLSGAIEALNYISIMAPFLFMVGVLLRAFHWTSGIGAALVSFSFSFYTIFPFAYGIFLTGVKPPVVGSSEPTIALRVDDSATYQYGQALSELYNRIDFQRLTEIETFINLIYTKAFVGLTVASGLSLGMAMYLYSFLSKGSIIWGAPAGLMRLL